ncbi:hypothetical protein SAMD00019534_017490 [Acytostelium subglobosum LB1]|uniref:hypothetical protein n=1 Tax=Acytostelium subglobosum LB1 TaxID=1410327 RepID=UPI0006449A41|nr:hypothetical protein SAMD00019534_017490 [Acytostelium subglobosum LB1]GAM18574.1 hypothetical protein SAMD00019534_017490 [Acytostelium subglobosum LB1]|eukprot:XP_012757794.1 hypothetical protein SAMD00019534_017490 [Acytostelium subglobosum LB1]
MLNTCVKLTSLRLRQPSITCKSAKAIAANASSLERLNLSGCNLIAPERLSEIVKNAPRLRVLNLSSTLADSSILESMESHGAKALTALKLDYTNTLSTETNPIQTLSMIEPKLEVLHLPNYNEDHQILWNLLRKLPQLKKLKVPTNTNMHMVMQTYKEQMQEAIEDAFELPLSELTTIDLSTTLQSVSALTSIIALMPMMESISLANMKLVNDKNQVVEVSDTILAAIGPLFHNVKELDLSGLNIERRNIPCLISRCNQLQNLYLHNCVALTDRDIHELNQEFPSINFVGGAKLDKSQQLDTCVC